MILHEDLKVFPHKHQKKQLLPAQTVKKHINRAQILLSCIKKGTLPNLVFSDEKKFDVEQHFNAQNDLLASGSAMVWAAVTANGRSWCFCTPKFPRKTSVPFGKLKMSPACYQRQRQPHQVKCILFKLLCILQQYVL